MTRSRFDHRIPTGTAPGVNFCPDAQGHGTRSNAEDINLRGHFCEDRPGIGFSLCDEILFEYAMFDSSLSSRP